LTVLGACGPVGPVWDDPEREARLAVRVRANGFARFDMPVRITGDFSMPLRILEIGPDGAVQDEAVPFQVDFGRELTFLMKGETPAEQSRLYRIYMGEPPPKDDRRRLAPETEKLEEPKPLVTVNENAVRENLDSVLVASPSGSYYYHKQGAGFASLVDREGKDWISYRPGGGSAGEFRGIPNAIHPEGGFHPGAEGCESRVLADGPLMVRIVSRCGGDAWEGQWDIFPGFAQFTMLKAGHPYWFLYEGTPGGQLDVEGDYWAMSDGARRPVKDDWQGKVPTPRWVYFGDAALRRVLFVVHHDDDGAFDQFWQMEGNMTVFGFGRQYRCCEKSLTKTPAQFTIGLVESNGHPEIRERVEGAYRNLLITKGEIEKRPPM
jgi:hypothetical protein